MTKISIITPTYNCKSNLSILFETMKSQTCFDFEWIIVDGGSEDGTVDIFSSLITSFDLKVDIKKDFGIYDAINRGILLSTCNYYLVVGSDDKLFPNAVEKIINSLNNNLGYDFYCFSLYIGNKLFQNKKRFSWLYGMSGISSCHSVGLVIKKELHKAMGYYSNKFPLASDQYFVLKSYRNDATFIRFPNIITGTYSYDGESTTDFIGTLTEYYRVQLKVNPNQKFLQTVLFLCRFFKNIFKIH
jgi:glycosyltransferase involved in cell wall biosynthesis